MFHKILVAIDGSDGSNNALRYAIDVAKHYGADLHSISIEAQLSHYAATVGEVIEAKQEATEYFRRVVEGAEQVAEAAGIHLTAHVLPGHEVESIVRFAKDHGHDLLVIGFMGHSRIYERIWGGTSQNLTRLAPCSVLVVK